jgi:hypothetical protein
MYHVVCRDCDHEALERTGSAAERDASAHERERNHRVSVGRID